MCVKRIVLHSTLAAAIIFAVAIGYAGISYADHTEEGPHQDYRYCVIGPGNGIGWSWELVGPGGTLSMATTVEGANTTGGVVQNWVASINENRIGGSNFPNAQQVASDGCGPDPSAAFSITILDSSLPFEFFVNLDNTLDPSAGDDACEINSAPGGCAFNPTIIPIIQSVPAVETVGQVVLFGLLMMIGCYVLWRK